MTNTATGKTPPARTAAGQETAQAVARSTHGLKAAMATAMKLLARRRDLYVPNA